MDNIVEQLLAETRVLSQQEGNFPYERYEDLVDIREAVIQRIAQSLLSEVEQKYMQEIATYEMVILSRMEALKDEAMLGLGRMNASKKQRTAYDTQGMNESFMLDKRK